MSDRDLPLLAVALTSTRQDRALVLHNLSGAHDDSFILGVCDIGILRTQSSVGHSSCPVCPSYVPSCLEGVSAPDVLLVACGQPVIAKFADVTSRAKAFLFARE